MRNRFVSALLLASALLVTPTAFAQGKGKKPAAAAKKDDKKSDKKDDKKAAGKDDKKAAGKNGGPAREVSLDDGRWTRARSPPAR